MLNLLISFVFFLPIGKIKDEKIRFIKIVCILTQ